MLRLSRQQPRWSGSDMRRRACSVHGRCRGRGIRGQPGVDREPSNEGRGTGSCLAGAPAHGLLQESTRLASRNNEGITSELFRKHVGVDTIASCAEALREHGGFSSSGRLASVSRLIHLQVLVHEPQERICNIVVRQMSTLRLRAAWDRGFPSASRSGSSARSSVYSPAVPAGRTCRLGVRMRSRCCVNVKVRAIASASIRSL